jgi:pseudouridine-5'-phosphate glycosidase
MSGKPYLKISRKIESALEQGLPIVALESTVITHGLPYPHNYSLAKDLEKLIRDKGVEPATIAVIDGDICVGLEDNALERLATEEGMKKISLRDFAPTIVNAHSGGTTVAATMYVAASVGIKTFATGGIGGVHRLIPGSDMQNYDISTDLTALTQYGVVVVCAGVKAILDIAGTLELLETLGIPVIGYRSSDFPAFFCSSSGLSTYLRIDDAETIAEIASTHWGLGMESGILVANPPPGDTAIAKDVVEDAIMRALEDARELNIKGQQVTPFLLNQLNVITNGSTLQSNLALLKNNALLACEIACHLIRFTTGRL